MWTVVEKIGKREWTVPGGIECIQDTVLRMGSQLTPLAGSRNHFVRDGVGRSGHEVMVLELVLCHDLFDGLGTPVVFG